MLHKKIITYLLLIAQVFLVPLSFAYPVVQYYGNHWPMTSEIHSSKHYGQSGQVYFQLYVGSQPDVSELNTLRTKLSAVNPALSLKIYRAPSDSGGADQYRVLAGPVVPETLRQDSNALKAIGIDNFPIYFIDNSAFLATTSKTQAASQRIHNGNAARTVHDGVLTNLSSRLVGAETSDELAAGIGSYLRGEAQGYLNTSAENWLSQYGTAQVNVDIDDNFRMASGTADVLIPFFSSSEGEDAATWFIQPGVVFNADNTYNGRDFAHIGIGYRAKNANRFYGINAFYDHDLTRSHQRGSIGVEYGIDYLKLSGNYYIPLSGWKASVDQLPLFAGTPLEERPAEGFDARIRGYLPANPALSAEASYQQFFGDHIEVSNGSDPIDSPYQLDFALNFQPVPLLGFSIGYTEEEGGRSGFNANLTMTYQLGVPLSKQLDTRMAAAAGSVEMEMLGLVDREHNIRLEYRKQQQEQVLDIRFNQNEYLVREGEAKPLSDWLAVTGDKNAIAQVSYSGSGQEHVKNHYFVAPPFENTTRAGANRYTLSATIISHVDGSERRTPVDANIVVLPEHTLTLTEEKSSALANGSDTTTLIAKLADHDGMPIANEKIEVAVAKTDGSTLTATDGLTLLMSNNGITDDSGQVVIEATATKVAAYDITASYSFRTAKATVAFNADTTPGELEASFLDGGDGSVTEGGSIDVQVTLTDKSGNPLAGEELTIPAVPGLDFGPGPFITGPDGELTITVTSDGTSGDLNFTVAHEPSGATMNKTITVHKMTLTLTADKPSATTGESITFTATTKDHNAQPIAGETIAIQTVPELTLDKTAGTTDDNGQVTFTATSTTANDYTVAIQHKEQRISQDIKFTADATTGNLKITFPGDGDGSVTEGGSIDVQVTLTDKNGNPLVGEELTIPAVPGLEFGPGPFITGPNGELNITITSDGTSGNLDFTVEHEPSGATMNKTITVHKMTLTLKADRLSATAGESITFTATTKDHNDQPVAGETITIQPVPNLTLNKTAGTTDDNGQVTFTATSTTAGDYTVAIQHKTQSEVVTVSFTADTTPTGIIRVSFDAFKSTTTVGTPVKMEVYIASADGVGMPGETVTLPNLPDGIIANPTSAVTEEDSKARFFVTATAVREYAITAQHGTNGVTATETLTVK